MLKVVKTLSLTSKLLVPIVLTGTLLAACGASSASGSAIQLGNQQALLSAYRMTRQQRSFAIDTVETISTDGGSGTSQTKGYVYQTGTNPVSIDAKLTNQSHSTFSVGLIDSSELVVGSTVYFGIPSNELGLTTLSGAKWIQASLAHPPALLTSPLAQVNSTDPTSVLANFANRTHVTVTKVGPATVDGHTTTEYSASINPRQFLQEAAAKSASKSLAQVLNQVNFDGPIMVKFWIGSNQLLRQYTISMDISEPQPGAPGNNAPASYSIQVDLSQYGKTFPTVSAPTSGIINAKTFISALEAQGTPSASAGA
ncbi:hypothetical protein [Ferrimicrobium sp.]|uniref:hypothetical protein n=1 Tax=Ferrimicrobium sp. TaxID=2926050 RepID=UPI002635E762|nr:hypothetical protein [Ferrimicrobium sp.]